MKIARKLDSKQTRVRRRCLNVFHFVVPNPSPMSMTAILPASAHSPTMQCAEPLHFRCAYHRIATGEISPACNRPSRPSARPKLEAVPVRWKEDRNKLLHSSPPDWHWHTHSRAVSHGGTKGMNEEGAKGREQAARPKDCNFLLLI